MRVVRLRVFGGRGVFYSDSVLKVGRLPTREAAGQRVLGPERVTATEVQANGSQVDALVNVDARVVWMS